MGWTISNTIEPKSVIIDMLDKLTSSTAENSDHLEYSLGQTSGPCQFFLCRKIKLNGYYVKIKDELDLRKSSSEL